MLGFDSPAPDHPRPRSAAAAGWAPVLTQLAHRTDPRRVRGEV